ncbi:MAG: hypothetical protein HQK54_02890 [Oligoflexales bacterium]|nr:hypothetical protein [Oligoflexales bacterium]
MNVNTFTAIFIAGLIATCGTNRSHNGANLKNLPGEDPSEAALLSQGFNTVDGSIKGHCVELGPTTTQSGQLTGSTSEYRLLEISSEQSLRENLSVSAAASIKGSIYGGSGRFSFVSSVNKNSSSRYVLVQARFSNQMELASSFTFKQEALDLLKKGKQKEFVEQCGNEFVYGRRTGGEFYALYEYEFSSSEEEKRFSSAVSASGAAWKASANINSELSKFNMSAKVHVKVYRLGGSGAIPEIENLAEYGRKFPEIVAAINGSPVTLELITKDYTGVGPLESAANPALIERQKYVINNIAKNRDQASEKLATVRYVKMNLDKFEQVSVDELNKNDLDLVSYINKQNDAAVACFEDIWAGCILPETKFPPVNIPNRKWDNSNRCPRGYSWDDPSAACCRIESKVSCSLEGSNGECIGYETKREKVCL